MPQEREGFLGWATDRLIYHDALAPGAIRRVLTAAPAHRHAVFALIATEIAAEGRDPAPGDQHDGAAVSRAEIIRDGSPRDVLVEGLGHQPPTGLQGALKRISPLLLREPRLYGRLIEIYSRPECRAAARALRHLPLITGVMLNVLEVLPVTLINPHVLRRLDSIGDARSFLEAVRFAKFANTRATDAAFHDALANMRDETGLDGVLSRFVRRADRLLGAPLAADDEVQPVRQVRDMILTARRFRNCLATDGKIIGALLGYAAYAIFREEVVLEFVHMNTGDWLFVAAHAPRNGIVATELVAAARAKSVAGGVATTPRERGRRGRFGRFTDHYDPVCLNLSG